MIGARRRHAWHTLLIGCGLLLAALASPLEAEAASDPGGADRADALVRAQMVLSEQNREEVSAFTTLGALTNVVVLPLGIGIALAFAGALRAAGGEDPSPVQKIAPWVVLATIVWLDLAMVSQAAINSSTLARFRYGAYMAQQAREQLAAPEETLITKPEYTDAYVSKPAKFLFLVAWALPSAAALFAVVALLRFVHRRAVGTDPPPGLRGTWTATSVLTLLTLVILLAQAYIAVTVTASG